MPRGPEPEQLPPLVGAFRDLVLAQPDGPQEPPEYGPGQRGLLGGGTEVSEELAAGEMPCDPVRRPRAKRRLSHARHPGEQDNMDTGAGLAIAGDQRLNAGRLAPAAGE